MSSFLLKGLSSFLSEKRKQEKRVEIKLVDDSIREEKGNVV